MHNDKLSLALKNDSISKVLNQILDKLDKQSFATRTNNISVLINEKNFKELYEPSEYLNDETLEKDINNLVQIGLFSFSSTSKDYLRLSDRKVKLIFNKEYEKIIRSFYNREICDNKWLACLKEFKNLDEELFTILKTTAIKIEGKTEKEILTKFELWLNKPKISNSLRQESARCFWGMSKVFENHKLLANYLKLNTMPILLQIHAKSEEINTVLFIENLETFHSCIQSNNQVFKNTVLIYSSGYKASAKRVRQIDGSKLFFTNDCKFSNKSKEDFILWIYQEKELDINTYFWGDFDFEGIGILAALKSNFKNLQAWQVAYNVMIKAIKANFGHTAKMSGKDKQKEPKETSCFYTDNILIPLLLEKKLFLDQEFVDIDGL